MKQFFMNPCVILLCAVMLCFYTQQGYAADSGNKKNVAIGTGNPYLPLWEHLPDGEPRVFDDPDCPGKKRAYIIGSHDVRFNSYCGSDIRMWSAPVEDLTDWRDEGAIFTYRIHDQWDVMYAPDIVEIKEKNGKKVYYLFPHSRGYNREAMVCKGDRPDGPFTPLNLNEDGTRTIPGSILGFDPSVFVEEITDPKDPDYEIGFRAYGFWGFQRSMAAQLDQKTMYSVRPGTEIIPYFIPASRRYGEVRDPAGTSYPALYKEQNPSDFNFFEASSIRQVGNKYVMIFSGYSGPDYGLGSTNSALRYAFGDSPMGPWRSGGVLVDSRGVVLNRDGSQLQTSNAGHNTHGSLQKINGQWYVFYHRPPRGFGFARQAMVAPVHIEWDETPVAAGGKVTISGYDPYAKDSIWQAKASNGNKYTGAEVTSEGFQIFGLDPYKYYSAGYACYLSNVGSQQDSWDIWRNDMPIHVQSGDIIGYKYFGFGGLKSAQKGLKPFKGTEKGNKTAFNLFLTPETDKSFKIAIWMDGPWENDVWQGQKIGEIIVPSGSASVLTKYSADVSEFVDKSDKKHAIFLVAEGNSQEKLGVFHGLGFSKKKQPLDYPAIPEITMMVDGQKVALPTTPVRSTNANGITGYNQYEVRHTLSANTVGMPVVSASSTNPELKISIVQPGSAKDGNAVVTCDYKGAVKTYTLLLARSSDNGNGTFSNPVLWSDVPDPDVIRVGKDYYLMSTTMHLMPGAPVMHSKDLVNWEIINYVFDKLTDTPNYDMKEGTAYGRGQWATSIRYHNGKYYVYFSPNDKPYRGYVYTTADPAGPWELKARIPHFHDASLFFDGDGKAYIFYGTGQIRELKPDLTDVQPDGVDMKLFERDPSETGLLEGSRVVKHDGKYYLLMISWPQGSKRRQVCYRADNITGPYEKKVILEDNFAGFPYAGQGCIVDDVKGNWYGVIFQDRGGVGRVLTLMPCRWEDGWPMLGDSDGHIPAVMDKPVQGGSVKLLVHGDDFNSDRMDLCWQWNHNPIDEAWSLTERPGYLRLKTARVADHIFLAPNTLTQRMEGPGCSAVISMDVSHMNEGDVAGISAFNGDAALLSVKMSNGRKYLVMSTDAVSLANSNKAVTGVKTEEKERIELNQSVIYLRIDGDFRLNRDMATCYYSLDNRTWQKIGTDFKMRFDYRRLFMGTKYAIFNYATQQAGGYIDVDFFEYHRIAE